MNRIFAWLYAQRQHLVEVGLAIFLYELFNFAYDFLFYPFALAYWGLEKGWVIAAAGSVLQCSIMFWYYDYKQIDWLKANVLRSLEDKDSKSRLETFAAWIGKEKLTLRDRIKEVVLFVSLTTVVDPLIVAIYFQRRHFKGLRASDWGILIAALVSANTIWFVKVGFVVEGIKVAYHFSHLFLVSFFT